MVLQRDYEVVMHTLSYPETKSAARTGGRCAARELHLHGTFDEISSSCRLFSAGEARDIRDGLVEAKRLPVVAGGEAFNPRLRTLSRRRDYF